MGKLLSTPKKDGFFMPFEGAKHIATWMMWPYRRDNWQKNAFPAQKVFLLIAKLISKYELVNLIVNPEHYQNVKKIVGTANIKLWH